MLNSEQILAVLWKRRLTVLITVLVTMAAITAVTLSLPKVFSTTSYVLVNSKANGSAFEATQVNQVVLKTYSELLGTRNLAELVVRDLPPNCRQTPVALQGSVAVQAVAQSQLLEITAEGSSPECAQTIANAYARTFIGRVGQLGGKTASTNITLAEPAALVTAAVRPKPKLYLMIGFLLALAAGAGMALLRHRLDQSLEIDDTTTEIFGLPVIGRIPEPSSSRMRNLRGTDEAQVEDAPGLQEAFRLVLANLSFANLGQRPATLAVVSAGPGEGKTTCVKSLGRAAAENKLEVAVVDGDLRNPSLTARLIPGNLRAAGFSNFLGNRSPAPIRDFVTDFPGSTLHVVPSGPTPPNPAALLASKTLVDFDRRMKRIFELVVYDTPPLSVAVDASLVAAKAEGVVLVLDARKTRRATALKAVDQLQRAKTNVLGVVINRVPNSGDTSYHYYGSATASAASSDVPQLPEADLEHRGTDRALETIESLQAPAPVEYQPGR